MNIWKEFLLPIFHEKVIHQGRHNQCVQLMDNQETCDGEADCRVYLCGEHVFPAFQFANAQSRRRTAPCNAVHFQELAAAMLKLVWERARETQRERERETERQREKNQDRERDSHISTWSSGRSRIFLRGAPNPKLVLFCNFFAKSCMKMKEFGAWGGLASLAPPLDPPMWMATR